MEWRYNYSSYYIEARSLQDHMEVGMAQFGVKINKKSVSGWAYSSTGVNTRVWRCQRAKLKFRRAILEYGFVYSSMHKTESNLVKKKFNTRVCKWLTACSNTWPIVKDRYELRLRRKVQNKWYRVPDGSASLDDCSRFRTEVTDRDK